MVSKLFFQRSTETRSRPEWYVNIHTWLGGHSMPSSEQAKARNAVSRLPSVPRKGSGCATFNTEMDHCVTHDAWNGDEIGQRVSCRNP